MPDFCIGAAAARLLTTRLQIHLHLGQPHHRGAAAWAQPLESAAPRWRLPAACQTNTSELLRPIYFSLHLRCRLKYSIFDAVSGPLIFEGARKLPFCKTSQPKSSIFLLQVLKTSSLVTRARTIYQKGVGAWGAQNSPKTHPGLKKRSRRRL